MKRKFYLTALFTLIISLIYAGAQISDSSGKSEGGNVIISWSVTSEDNVAYYMIERSAVSTQDNQVFESVGKVAATNKSYYEFVDKSAYKANDAVYVYRIAIYDQGNSAPSYSKLITVVHNTTGVQKRTWGSIKDLFR